jgi:hypothetical protein
MHQKLTKHGRVCKQNNQLPTKSHHDLKDNFNQLHIFGFQVSGLGTNSSGVYLMYMWQ